MWTESVGLALETAVRVRAGNVWVNAHNLFDAATGFGGYKESGCVPCCLVVTAGVTA